jgi:hypothetical protein
MLHIDKQKQKSNDRKSTTSNPPADVKATTNAEVNTYCSFKGRPKNHILLATAIVEVKNKSGQYVMQSIVRQCLSVTLHNRKVCAMIEVIKDSNTYFHSGHQ